MHCKMVSGSIATHQKNGRNNAENTLSMIHMNFGKEYGKSQPWVD